MIESSITYNGFAANNTELEPSMRPAQNLQLAVWQSISRHLDVSESTNLTAALLAQHVPVSTLIIYRVDTEHRRVRVIANGPESPAAEPFNELEFQESAWRRLDRWMRQQTLLHRVDDLAKEDSIFGLLYPSSPAGDWLIAPLHGEHGARGILLALAKPKTKFTELDIELLESILEPMGVALDNDARLHELAALREAAEAERQSLLRRMGRNDTGETIVGEDAGLAPVMQRVDLVSRSEVPVLILGETGTGKELVARAIHNRNERHSGPFMRVNCGAIPRELIDSQLFGHEKGSFTGASETRQGWFERADMGTLFLDEIGELPLDAQVRFLRVLQDGYVERVGGSKPIRVNVRVVAATHRDLAAMVREGTFREDLWYRIAVFPILLPPLRDRVGDIPSLARHFAQRAAIRFGLAPVLPSDADIELLQSYDWPGNIRELGAVIDRAAILGDGRSLELAAALGVSGGSPRRVEQSTAIIQPNGDAVRQQRVATLNDAMRAHIELALRLARGRIEGPRGAAKQLAINPHTLRARMRKLKIDWSAYRDAASDDLD
jgi:transcriptional regulator with GAF, ATPase, and Fis domain